MYSVSFRSSQHNDFREVFLTFSLACVFRSANVRLSFGIQKKKANESRKIFKNLQNRRISPSAQMCFQQNENTTPSCSMSSTATRIQF